MIKQYRDTGTHTGTPEHRDIRTHGHKDTVKQENSNREYRATRYEYSGSVFYVTDRNASLYLPKKLNHTLIFDHKILLPPHLNLPFSSYLDYINNKI